MPNDTASISCPKCGAPMSFKVRIRNGAQSETCKKCHKPVQLQMVSGEVRSAK